MTKTQNGANGSHAPFQLPGFDLEPLIAMNRKAMEAAVAAQSHGYEHAAKFSAEVFKFMSQRLERDRDVALKLAQCKSPNDALDVCSKFVDTAAKDYSKELELLAGLYSDGAKDAMESARSATESATEVLKSGPKAD
jgi:hypothetical protein